MDDRRQAEELTSRRILVPELDGEIFAVSEPLDELALSLGEWAEEEPGEVPLPLHRPASEGVGEIRVALNGGVYRALLCTPGGRYEHEPVAVVELPQATIDRLGEAAAELGRAVPSHVAVGDVMRDFAAGWARPGEVSAERLVEVAAGLHGVCDLRWGEVEQRIARRLKDSASAGEVGVRVVLDEAEEAAYRRIRDRLVRMWDDFDPLARRLY